MPKVSVIMPVYNVEAFVGDAVRSVLRQSLDDFELLIIDDVSPDGSIEICESFADPRIRILRHTVNRGLAGARNTGIRHAFGDYLAFIDSDDFWHSEKLAQHVGHLDANPDIGVSFSRSAFVDAGGVPTHCYQMPRLRDISAGYYLCRNPIGNGSAPVIRREVFDAIRFKSDLHGAEETCYFDETLRRSEDIECWIRIVLTTDWVVEGLPEALTYYRLNAGGLSANLLEQLESWEAVITKTRRYAPEFVAAWERPARAYQLRYLARQAIRLRDGRMASRLLHRALRTDPGILRHEPGRTLLTAAAAYLLWLTPDEIYLRCEQIAHNLVGSLQKRRITRDLRSQSA
jgi:glycosyltransferase involved in cell wall biosynthesis